MYALINTNFVANVDKSIAMQWRIIVISHIFLFAYLYDCVNCFLMVFKDLSFAVNAFNKFITSSKQLFVYIFNSVTRIKKL